MQAAGWLAVLLPTNQVQKGKSAWNAWLADWMAIWAAQPNDTFLGMCIMGLISRLARNDTQCRASLPTGSPGLAASWQQLSAGLVRVMHQCCRQALPSTRALLLARMCTLTCCMLTKALA